MLSLDNPRLPELLAEARYFAWLLGAAVVFALVASGWRLMRRWWIEWRWQRNRSPTVEDERDHRWALGNLEPDAANLVQRGGVETGLLRGLWLIAAIVGSFLAALWFDLDWQTTFSVAFGGGGALMWLWQYLDPPPDRETPLNGLNRTPGEVTVPPEAITGAVAGAAIIGAILLLAWLT